MAELAGGDTGAVPAPPVDVKRPEDQVLELLIGDEEESPEPLETEPVEEQAQEGKAVDGVDSHVESETDAETPEVRDLTELADAIDVDADFLYGLSVPMGDGRQPMTIGELKDAATNLVRSRAELDKEKIAVDAEKSRLSYDKELNELEARLSIFDEQFEAQEELRRKVEKEDPGKVARAVQYYETARRQMADQIEEKRLARDQDMEEKLQQHRANEAKLLGERLPEWKDSELAKRELEGVWKIGAEYGFTADELRSIEDHRALHVLVDLMRAKGKIESVKTVPKRVAKLPKKLKSATKSSVDDQGRRSLAERARKSGRLADKVDAVTSLLINPT